MNWVSPPEQVRRFSLHQLLQHGTATGLWFVLAISAALSLNLPGIWGGIHITTGIVASFFILYHALYLVSTGIRHDMPLGKVAFLPVGREWERLGARTEGGGPPAKYSPEEKGDYLNILIWAIPLVATGVLLRWPGLLGVPGPGAYSWIRVAHAGFGAAWTLHILLVHIPRRWLDMPSPFRRAILTGKVPLELAEERAGWIEELVEQGVLVPLPDETVPEADRDSRAVRDLFENGNRLAREGRFGEAAASFEEALRLFPDYSQARFNLAVARMKEGRGDLAEEEFLRFIEYDPFNPMAEKARDHLESLRKRAGPKGSE